MSKPVTTIFVLIISIFFNNRGGSSVLFAGKSNFSILQNVNERILRAVKQSKFKEVQALIEQGANCNYIDAQGWSLLMYAVQAGDINTVKLLVESGSNINYANKEGFSVTLTACRYEQHAILKYLIKQGAMFEMNNHICYDCLSYAARGSDNKNLHLLVEVGADINSKDCEGVSPLMLASWFTTQAILDLGADINAIDNAGNTAIMLSIIEGNELKFKTLLRNSPNIDMVNKRGESALGLAVKYDRKNMIATLKSN